MTGSTTTERRRFGDAVLLATSVGHAPIAGMALMRGDELDLCDVRGMPPEDQPELLPLCRQTVDADDLIVFSRPKRSAGRVVHFYAGVPIRGDDGHPVGAVFVAAPQFRQLFDRDQDALWALGRQVERELDSMRKAKAAELLNRLASKAHRADDLDQALRACLDVVCEYAEWPVGHVYVPAEDLSGTLVPARMWRRADDDRFARLSELTESVPLQHSTLPGQAALTRSPKWTNDLAVDGRFAEADLEELGVSSAFALPVHAGEKLVAVLEFFHRDARTPGPHLVGLIAELGREVGLAAERIHDRMRLVRIQIALRDTVHQLRQIIGTAHDAFVSLDGDGVVTEWNKAAESMFGWSREEILGLPLADTVIPGRYRDAHRLGIARLKETGDGPVLGKQVELAALRKEGDEFPIELLVWQPQSSGPYRFNAFIRDISERKDAERALREAFAREQEVVEELRRVDMIKTDFIANVSHELRTPLTSISGYLELLVDGVAGDLTTDQLDMTAIIQRNTQRLLRLVEDILTIGKMDSGQFQPNLAPVDLCGLVTAAIKSVEPSAVVKALNMVSQIPPEPITVRVDPNQLDRALLNLLSNAVKFTPAAGSVAVRVRRTGNEARITVADTGIGIPADELPRLFSRFFRSSLAVQNEIQGTGLGLAIVKYVVEQHGGHISVTSCPGEGTMVAVVLPAEAPEVPE